MRFGNSWKAFKKRFVLLHDLLGLAWTKILPVFVCNLDGILLRHVVVDRAFPFGARLFQGWSIQRDKI